MGRTVCRAARRRLGWLVRSSRSARVRHVDVGAAPCHGRARPRVVVEQLVRPGESKPHAHTSSREAHTRKECHSGLAAGRPQDACDSPIRFRGLTAPRSLRAAARWFDIKSSRDGAESCILGCFHSLIGGSGEASSCILECRILLLPRSTTEDTLCGSTDLNPQPSLAIASSESTGGQLARPAHLAESARAGTSCRRRGQRHAAADYRLPSCSLCARAHTPRRTALSPRARCDSHRRLSLTTPPLFAALSTHAPGPTAPPLAPSPSLPPAPLLSLSPSISRQGVRRGLGGAATKRLGSIGGYVAVVSTPRKTSTSVPAPNHLAVAR